MTGSTGPYARAASQYWAAGWRGVLPLPANGKWPPPEGYTGAAGATPSYADITAWAEDRPDANIGIRLPPDVIGIDVDDYEGKRGNYTIDDAERRWCELPDTWRSTARGYTSGSGIWLYRVPEGLRWPGQVGPDVEIIQHRHRYMVAPPSIHPSAGRIYQWYAPGASLPVPATPSPGDLAHLPDAWVAGLTQGMPETTFEKGEATPGEIKEFMHGVVARDRPCRIMLARLNRLLSELGTGSAGSRHDLGLRGIMAFARLTSEGHTGGAWALAQLHQVWLEAVTRGAGARTVDEASGEWHRMLSGAVGWFNGVPWVLEDPCADPFAGILPPELAPDTRSDATLPARDQLPKDDRSGQGDAASPPMMTAPVTPPERGGAGTVPPAWVLDQTEETGAGAQPDTGLNSEARQRKEHAEASTPDPTSDTVPEWDRRAVAVALEVERLEVRRDARLQLAHAEHMRTFRQPPSYSLRELLALPEEPVTWRVRDVLPAGGNILLAAQYKTGKTTLVNELTASLADGREFLGSYKVEPCVVALFNYEVGQAQYGRWLRDLSIDNVDSVHVFNLRGFTLPLGVPLVRDQITRWLAERHVSVWIVDPFARAFSGGGDENSNADVGPFLEILDEIKERSGVTELVLPTHTGRTEFAVGAERARGATRLDDWCDVRWLLTRGNGDDEENRYFRATGRDVDTEETKLEFDPLTRALTLGEGSRPRRTTGRAGGPGGMENAAQSRSGLVEDVVVEVLGDEPGISLRRMRDELRLRGVGARNTAVADAVRRLEQQGIIRRSTIPATRGGSVTVHHLTNPPAGDE